MSLVGVPLHKLPFRCFSEMPGDLTADSAPLHRYDPRYQKSKAVKLQHHIAQHADKKVNPFCRACVELSK